MKILMVGLGGIGQRHLRNLRALVGDDVRVLAVRTRGRQEVLTDTLTVRAGAELDATYRVERVPDLAAGLAEKPDIVFVTNPSSLHVPVARAAAEAGCHLFIEKPLSDSLESVDELVKTVEQRRLVGLVGYQLRFHPCFRRLKGLLDDRVVGSLLAVRFEVGEYLPGWHTYEDYRQMYASRRDLGGGVILSQIHELDLVYWLFGFPRRVFALGGHWSSLDVDVEDTASLLLECEHDGRPLPVHVQQDYVQRPPSRRAEIVGDRGKIVVDLTVPEVRVTDAASGAVAVHGVDGFQRNQVFLDELGHLLACVREGTPPTVSVRDGVASLRIALAAHRSIATGGVVVP
jgi:predicted dehydrogenase